MFFFEASNTEQLNNECAILAERWKWSHEEIRAMSTVQRRDYVQIVTDMYERERKAMEKVKH